jgi:acyl carrier protein
MTMASPLGLRARLAATVPSARTRVLVDFLLQQLRDELGIEGDEVHPRSRFENLGIDSKRALEFKELLDEELGHILATTLMFDYPTPESLATYLVRVAFGDDAAAGGPASNRPEAAPGAAEAAEPADATGPADSLKSVEERLRRKLASYDV